MALGMRVSSAVVIFALLPGCGRNIEASRVQKTNPEKSSYESLTWVLQCPNDPLPLPPSDAMNPVLVDTGPHPLYRERLVGTPVKVMGKVCPVSQGSRDLLFVIDV